MSDQAPRLFLAPDCFKHDLGQAVGNKEEYHYLKRVLRLSEGDRVILLDGCGKVYQASVKSFSDNQPHFTIEKELFEYQEPPIKLVLAQALCKKDNFELVIQKATELGVSEIIPFTSRYTEVKLSSDKKVSKKLARWQEIAKNAAEQSRRLVIPKIHPPTSFEKTFDLAGERNIHSRFIFYEHADTTFKKALISNERNAASSDTIFIVVGAEGGFSDKEVDLAENNGTKPVSMGPRILRSETAGMIAVSLLMYEWGDLGGDSDADPS